MMVVVRNLDDLGRVVLPVDMRHSLDVGKGDPVEIVCDGTSVVVTKYIPSKECIFCKSVAALQSYKGKVVCARCRKELALVQGGDEG